MGVVTIKVFSSGKDWMAPPGSFYRDMRKQLESMVSRILGLFFLMFKTWLFYWQIDKINANVSEFLPTLTLSLGGTTNLPTLSGNSLDPTSKLNSLHLSYDHRIHVTIMISERASSFSFLAVISSILWNWRFCFRFAMFGTNLFVSFLCLFLLSLQVFWLPIKTHFWPPNSFEVATAQPHSASSYKSRSCIPGSNFSLPLDTTNIYKIRTGK